MALKLNSIVRGKVVSVKDFGAFVSIEGSTRQGLVHRSQISNHRIDDASEVLEVGEEVFCKIISDEDGKIGLSMKFVNQTSGDDKDPNNVLAAQQAKRRSGPGREQVPIRLEAELNTLCTRCKGKGHMANTCFVRLGEPALDLLYEPDSPPPETSPVTASPPRKKRDSHSSKRKEHKNKHRHRSRSPSARKEKKEKKRKHEGSSKSRKSNHKRSKDS